MSSTKRGRLRQRQDNYPTPAWCVHRLFEAISLPRGTWLEPCAGEGAIIRAVEKLPSQAPTQWEALEIRQRAVRHLDAIPSVVATQCNALELLQDPGLHYVVAISNPPFSLAGEFISVCRERATHVVMLLRLNYLASEKRHALMTASRPDVYVLPNRPSFVGGGKTDSIEYAWFHWHPKSSGKLQVLALTPATERIQRRRP